MSKDEAGTPNKKVKKWQIFLLVLIALAIVGQFSGASDSEDPQKSMSAQVETKEEPVVDLFTQRACRKFREFASEAGKGVLTISEMREKFKVSYEAAQFSERPKIVSSATSTLAALTNGDVEAFSNATQAMLEACVEAGQ